MEQKPWFKHYPDHIATEISFPNQSLPEILNETTEQFPNNNAISFFGRKITYQALFKMSHGSPRLCRRAESKKEAGLPSCFQIARNMLSGIMEP